MVDFPEYYEQMQGSLRAPPSAPATTVRPVTGRDAIERYDAARLLDEATQFRPPPARPPVNRAPAPSVNETRNQPAPQSFAPPQPQQPSVLDMLRQRMQSQIDDESNQRLREIGIGMLRSRSPNFFSALGEGFEAAETGSRSRMDRLRQIADAERQQQELETRQAAQRAEEEYRRQTIGLRERELAAGRRPNIITMIDPETRNAVLVNAETGQVVSRTEFRPVQELRNAPRPLSQAQIANIRQQVTRLASTDAGIVEGVTPTPAQITRRDELANQYFRDRLDAAAAGLLDFQGGGAGTATTGGAGAPAGTQPSQTLTYPRTPQ